MKKLLLILLYFLILFPLVSFGQTRPDSVDNSAWFPPAENQWHNNCSQFSLIYYLKSYLWNKHFQRNPNLPENQFSADFVWNQTIASTSHYSGNISAFVLMSRQGCATTSNFPMQTDQENLPDFEAKESGFNFRSKSFSEIWLSSHDSVSVSGWLNNLKDSLSQGICFSMHIPIFNEIDEVTADDPFYRWNSGMSQTTILGSHSVIVVGYDDNREAFKIINSWGQDFADNGYFYMTYNWLYNVNFWQWTCGFLKEDFDYQSSLSLNLDIQGMITGNDIDERNNIFVDTVYTDSWDRRFDYQMNDYFYFTHLVTIKKINNQSVPSSLTGDGLNNSHNIVFLPRHNHNGHHQLIEDLTTYVTANSLVSLELLVVDPVSSIYTMGNNSVIYSYTRTAQTAVNEAYIKFLGTPKRIVGQVIDLPDTTIVTRNFYSYPAAFHLTPPSSENLFIKTCTSVLKRKKITFSIEDTVNVYNNPPYFTSIPTDTLRAKTGNLITFQFQAQDPDGDSLRYHLSSLSANAQIDSISGLFQYQSNEPIIEQFEVIATDGQENVAHAFIIKIDKSIGIDDPENSPSATLAQNYPNPFFGNSTISFTLIKGGYVSLKVYNLLGKELNTLLSKELYPGTYNVIFNAGDLPTGIYTYRLQVDNFFITKKMVLTR